MPQAEFELVYINLSRSTFNISITHSQFLATYKFACLCDFPTSEALFKKIHSPGLPQPSKTVGTTLNYLQLILYLGLSIII